MGLIAWYPLDGDLRDYSGMNRGLSAVGNFVANNDGKIGKCYMSSDASAYATSGNVYLGGSQTFCLWIKLSTYSTSPTAIFTHHDYTTTSNIGINLSGNKIGVSIGYTDGTREWSGRNSSTTIELNKWYHIAVSHDQVKNTISVYVNGTKEYNATLTKTVKHTEKPFQLNRWSVNYTGYMATGRYNDVRVYDECLSDQEISEISKAKMLHYNFNYGVNRNMVKNSDLKTGWATGYCTDIRWNDVKPPLGVNSQVVSFIDNVAQEGDNQSGYWYSYGNYTDLQEAGIQYTISVYVRTNDSNFRIKAYTADNSEVGRCSTEYITVPNDGQWHRVVWNPITPPAGSVSESLSFHFYYGNLAGEDQRTWLCAPKMERGTVATPFSDYQAPTSPVIIKDSSGFMNDAQFVSPNDPYWHNESVLGTGSYCFENSVKMSNGYYRYAISKAPLRIPEQGTISFFIKHSGATNGDNKYAVGFQNFCSMNNNGLIGLIYYYDNSNYTTFNGSASFWDDSWHMYTITWDSEAKTAKLYKDGVKIKEGATSTMAHAGTFKYFNIGSAWAITYGGFSGYLDDIRLYATMLSDQDVENLYKVKASVYNNGTITLNHIDESTNEYRTVSIISSGFGQGAATVKFGGALVQSTGRSWGITHINKNLQIVGNWNYDVYGDAVKADEFLLKFRTIPNEDYIIVNTNDEPNANSLAIRNEIAKYGGGVLSYPWTTRCAYYCILRKTGSRGVIAERFSLTTTGEQTILLQCNSNNINKKSILTTRSANEFDYSGLETKTAYGANWVKMFYHANQGGTVLFNSMSELLNVKSDNKKSDLNRLGQFRGKDGKFEFLLEYPGITGYNRWKQSSNPVNESITGYEAIQLTWTTNAWGGLAPSSVSSTFIDGSPGDGTWYYAIGSRAAWSGKIPGPNVAIDVVELWVRCDDPMVFKICKDGTTSSTKFIEN